MKNKERKEHKNIRGFYSKKLVFELVKKCNLKKLDKQKIQDLYLKKYDSEDIPDSVNEEIDSLLSFKDFKQYLESTEREITKHAPMYRGFMKLELWRRSYKS